MSIGDEWRPHQLYRLYDADGRLLYVGVTRDLCRRLREHQRRASWFAEVVSGTSEQHSDWFAGRAAERATIADEAPIHNQDRSLRPTDHSDRSDRRVTKLKALRSLPQQLLDLRGYVRVTESDRRSLQTGKRAHDARVRGGTSPNSPWIGHCGHCHWCSPSLLGGAR